MVGITMYPGLSVIEICIYFILWIAGVSYSVYQVYVTGKYSIDYESYGNFAPGWSFLGRRKDVTDYEWNIWNSFLYIILPWMVVHIFGAELIRWTYRQLLPLWYFIIATVFLINFIGPAGTMWIILHPCIFYLALQLKDHALLWVISLAALVCNNMDYKMVWLDLPSDLQYLLHVAIAWLQLRCISFCLDTLYNYNKLQINCNNFIEFLGYCFYLPVLFMGPFILYKDFVAGVTRPYMKWTAWRLLIVFLNLLRFIGWWFLTELYLHYIYFNALQIQPENVKRIGPWALYGMGYCMGQFFMTKYVVIYGIPATVARAEQINAPRHPKCIGRIHLYSNMWKYFDQGLYSFLTKYIYVPCLGQEPNMLRRIMASFVCFVFVYVWHNTYLVILVWSVLNFLGVTIEAICKSIGSSSVYQQWEKRLLTQRNMRRFHALMATPLFMMSAISNFYFFGGMEIGNIFVKRLISGTFPVNSILFLFCYCCCQVSIEVNNWEQRRKRGIH